MTSIADIPKLSQVPFRLTTLFRIAARSAFLREPNAKSRGHKPILQIDSACFGSVQALDRLSTVCIVSKWTGKGLQTSTLDHREPCAPLFPTKDKNPQDCQIMLSNRFRTNSLREQRHVAANMNRLISMGFSDPGFPGANNPPCYHAVCLCWDYRGLQF